MKINYTKEQLDRLDKEDWETILKDDPLEELQLETVKQDGETIKYIKNPPLKVQLEAVRNNGFAIRHIKAPLEVVQLEAINKNYGAMMYIPYRSQKLLDEYERLKAEAEKREE